MGVSFKVARVGARYKPKQLPIESKDADDNASANDSEQRSVEVDIDHRAFFVYRFCVDFRMIVVCECVDSSII